MRLYTSKPTAFGAWPQRMPTPERFIGAKTYLATQPQVQQARHGPNVDGKTQYVLHGLESGAHGGYRLKF
jgi:hypothetical protein